MSRPRPVWPVGASAAQAAGWPMLAEARGSLRHALALRRASWPRSEPPCFPHRSQAAPPTR
eukprot:scaffold66156_cov41-Phaeocystis_antarctica.AAC.2